jgi:hypothetical protein
MQRSWQNGSEPIAQACGCSCAELAARQRSGPGSGRQSGSCYSSTVQPAMAFTTICVSCTQHWYGLAESALPLWLELCKKEFDHHVALPPMSPLEVLSPIVCANVLCFGLNLLSSRLHVSPASITLTAPVLGMTDCCVADPRMCSDGLRVTDPQTTNVAPGWPLPASTPPLS